MDLKRNLVITVLLIMVSACSTQSIKPEQTVAKPMDSEIIVEELAQQNAFSATEMTRMKAGKLLKLVKIMEGGACKNKQQGATGLFRLYANPADISRIKQQQGAAIFADFELQIQNLSMLAMQHAIEQLDFQHDQSAQQGLAKQLADLFTELIVDDMAKFEINTSLTIDVIPILDSLNIYLDGCEMLHQH